MDILEEKDNLYLTDDVKYLINLFKYKDDKIIFKGSASKKVLKYFGDYDFITNIKKPDAQIFYNFLYNMLTTININPDLFLIEIKQQTKDDKIRYRNLDEFDFETFNENYKDTEFIKIDIIFYFDRRFIESSIIYNFDDKRLSNEELINKMKEDIDEFIKDKNYMKVIKRIFSIERINKNYDVLKMIIRFLNSNVGEESQKLSNLETIQLLKEHYKLDKFNKARVKLNLKEIDCLGSIEDNINELKNYVNDRAESFLNNWLL